MTLYIFHCVFSWFHVVMIFKHQIVCTVKCFDSNLEGRMCFNCFKACFPCWCILVLEKDHILSLLTNNVPIIIITVMHALIGVFLEQFMVSQFMPMI